MIRRTAPKRSTKSTGPSQEIRELVMQRAKNRCERCGSRISGYYSIHHRTPRGMGGTKSNANRLSNLVLLCGSGTTGCHGWVESHREEAKEKGYLVPRSAATTDVALMPLFGMPHLLSDEI